VQEYKYKGRVVGRFFDEQGQPTALHQAVFEGSAAWKASEVERKNKRLAYPTCSSHWSSTQGARPGVHAGHACMRTRAETRHCAGAEVWCNDGLYPRKLTEMVSGVAEQRCACFEQQGWSNLRALYPGCEPAAHRCKLLTDAPASDQGAATGAATVCSTAQATSSAGQQCGSSAAAHGCPTQRTQGPAASPAAGPDEL
jgi:hypothetical protein